MCKAVRFHFELHKRQHRKVASSIYAKLRTYELNATSVTTIFTTLLSSQIYITFKTPTLINCDLFNHRCLPLTIMQRHCTTYSQSHNEIPPFHAVNFNFRIASRYFHYVPEMFVTIAWLKLYIFRVPVVRLQSLRRTTAFNMNKITYGVIDDTWTTPRLYSLSRTMWPLAIKSRVRHANIRWPPSSFHLGAGTEFANSRCTERSFTLAPVLIRLWEGLDFFFHGEGRVTGRFNEDTIITRGEGERERERTIFISFTLSHCAVDGGGIDKGQDRSEVVVTASRRFIDGRRPDEWVVHATLVRLATVGITHTRPLVVSWRLVCILLTYELYLWHCAAKFADRSENIRSRNNLRTFFLSREKMNNMVCKYM